MTPDGRYGHTDVLTMVEGHTLESQRTARGQLVDEIRIRVKDKDGNPVPGVRLMALVKHFQEVG